MDGVPKNNIKKIVGIQIVGIFMWENVSLQTHIMKCARNVLLYLKWDCACLCVCVCIFLIGYYAESVDENG